MRVTIREQSFFGNIFDLQAFYAKKNPGIVMKNQSAFRIFILEDDVWYGSMLQHYLSLNPDYDVKRFETPDKFFAALHESPRTEVKRKYDFSTTMIGNSDAMQKVFGMIEKATQTNITISIYGETGSGKEMVAKAIHYHSDRQKKSFVAVNVAAIPRDLIESELFGHEKGAFTGAVTRRIGKFEEADGGSLFLDEIGEMELSLQAKLLRVLQEREITRIGGNQVIKIEVRIIVATHRNLQEEVKAGRFLDDLYFRILGLPILLPPLRQRGQDIILIAKYFLDQFTKDNQLKKFKISPEAQEKLLHYPFPGNVCELKSVIELAAVMAEDTEIRPENINFTSILGEDNFMLKDMTLQQYLYKIIRSFLNKNDNNVLEVARQLDIGKSSIYRYLKEMEAAGI